MLTPKLVKSPGVLKSIDIYSLPSEILTLNSARNVVLLHPERCLIGQNVAMILSRKPFTLVRHMDECKSAQNSNHRNEISILLTVSISSALRVL